MDPEVGDSEDQRSSAGPSVTTMAGLVIRALGISILWGSGVEFPIYPPPGIIRLAGTLLVGLVRRPLSVGLSVQFKHGAAAGCALRVVEDFTRDPHPRYGRRFT